MTQEEICLPSYELRGGLLVHKVGVTVIKEIIVEGLCSQHVISQNGHNRSKHVSSLQTKKLCPAIDSLLAVPVCACLKLKRDEERGKLMEELGIFWK